MFNYIKDAIKTNSWKPNKEVKEDSWQPCIRCNSNRVNKTGFLYVFFAGLITLSISFWLLIIPPVGIVGIIAGIVMMVVSPFASKQLQCKDCKKVWKPIKKGSTA